jgi:hypothetical protein
VGPQSRSGYSTEAQGTPGENRIERMEIFGIFYIVLMTAILLYLSSTQFYCEESCIPIHVNEMTVSL